LDNLGKGKGDMANDQSRRKVSASSKTEAKKVKAIHKASASKKSGKGGAKAQADSKPMKFPQRKPTADEIAHKQALDRFSAGLELVNQGQFSRAKAIFERLVDNPSREVGERSKVYLNICNQRVAKPAVNLKSVDDMYDYAVTLANEGQPEQAEEYLRKAIKQAPKSDFLYYALAATFALRNDVEGTLEYLDKAIQMNSRNRYQAQNDPDFESMLEDPRFTELIYPERP
jgi:tetratricopeptide (TPR) repeat protein